MSAPTIKEMTELCHAIAKSKGFWDKPRNTGEALMLVVTELAEAMEAHRKQVMTKLGIHSVAELTKYAIRQGLTSLEV